MTTLINTYGIKGGSPDVYHTDPDCPHVTDDSLPIGESSHRTDYLRECSDCNGDSDRTGVQEKTCPYCGEVFGKLPCHLPCEGSQ